MYFLVTALLHVTVSSVMAVVRHEPERTYQRQCYAMSGQELLSCSERARREANERKAPTRSGVRSE